MSDKVIGATTIVVRCAATAKTSCEAEDRVPAFEDRFEKNAAKKIKPVAVTPWVCGRCWISGWRAIGPLDGSNRYDLRKVS